MVDGGVNNLNKSLGVAGGRWAAGGHAYNSPFGLAVFFAQSGLVPSDLVRADEPNLGNNTVATHQVDEMSPNFA